MAASKKYIQWVPIAPLNLLGRIQATVQGTTPPVYANQMEVEEGTPTDGYLVDLVLLKLVLPV